MLIGIRNRAKFASNDFIRIKYVFGTNLVIYFKNCVNLILLTKFCEVYLTFQTYFRILFELFTLFDTS